MKLVAGTQKGRRLRQPLTASIRPTSGKVREALFAILGDRVHHTAVLDLYAGTGALGLEALSRGASRVTFVEHAAAALKILRDNIARCAGETHTVVVNQDVHRFIKSFSTKSSGKAFDIVFADPPYRSDDIISDLELIGRAGMLSPTGILVLEHFSKHQVPDHANNLVRYRSARYGDTTLSFYHLLPSSDEGPTCV